MNNIRTIKGGVNLKGKVKVPGDKSISHRALIIGSIAKGETIIEGFLHSEDPLSTADCLRKLGVNIPEIKKDQTFTISGLGLDGIKEPKEILNCGNSGTTMRLLMGLLAGQEGKNLWEGHFEAALVIFNISESTSIIYLDISTLPPDLCNLVDGG